MRGALQQLDMGWGSRAAALLHDMHELVGEQAATQGRAGRVQARTEYHVRSHGVGERVDRSGRYCRRGIVMDADVCEIATNPRLKECASLGVERPSR